MVKIQIKKIEEHAQFVTERENSAEMYTSRCSRLNGWGDPKRLVNFFNLNFYANRTAVSNLITGFYPAHLAH